MRPQIKRLLELQDVDLRLENLRKLVAGFPVRLAEVESRLSVAKNKLAAAREAHTTSLKDRKKYELDVEQWREKAKKYRDQSYEVKTNEAFRALQHEIANADAEMARAEDRLLERMVAGEEFDRQIKSGETGLKEAEAVAASERKVLEQERAEVQSKLSAAEAERATVVADIPEGLLAEYNRISHHRHGALAQSIDEMCMKCGVRIRPHIYQILRRAEDEEIHLCESCGRILYYADPVPPQLGAETAATPPAEAAAAAAVPGAAPAREN
jgi:predicted  nucleic acid-binding Zn-ribbon protein